MPINALVQVVGCFTKATDGWTLEKASSPVRNRNGDETNAEELKAQGAHIAVNDLAELLSGSLPLPLEPAA